MNRRRMTRSLPGSASNELTSGTVHSAQRALKLVVRMCREEYFQGAIIYPNEDGGNIEIRINKDLDELRRIATVCLDAINADPTRMMELAAEWSAVPFDPWCEIGKAILSGDYTTLAI